MCAREREQMIPIFGVRFSLFECPLHQYHNRIRFKSKIRTLLCKQDFAKKKKKIKCEYIANLLPMFQHVRYQWDKSQKGSHQLSQVRI